MATIKCPNEAYSGISAGVEFVNGRGECSDPRLLQWFKDRGCTIEEEKKAPSKRG